MGKLIGWGSGAALLAAATLSVWGCSDDSSDGVDPIENGAGQGGEAPVGAGGGASGAPDTAAGAGGIAGGAAGAGCSSEPLCEGAECPTLDTLPVSCGTGWSWASKATTCGGTLVTAISASNTTRYCFDDQGILVGRVSITDVPAKEVVEGTDCTAAESGIDLCERDSCEPLPLQDWCDEHPFACPASAATFTGDSCQFFNSIRKYPSSCGGVVVVENQGNLGSASWSYDADGTLTGIVHTSDVSYDCAEGTNALAQPYGESCSPVGSGELVCEYDGGGGGGEGGAGGGGAAGAGG